MHWSNRFERSEESMISGNANLENKKGDKNLWLKKQ